VVRAIEHGQRANEARFMGPRLATLHDETRTARRGRSAVRSPTVAGVSDRVDVSFTSGGDVCAGWWFPARTGAVTAPCVVMAHGFSMTRGDGLVAYAEAFASAGVHVLVFDHRFLGDSGGTPRPRFRAHEQREDWRNAVAFVRHRADVDARRVVLWGFSFSGGHVTTLLGKGIDVHAAMLMCPFLDGLARTLATPLPTIAWILPRALADLAGRHNTIPVTGPAGARAAMTLPGEAEGFAASSTADSRWTNEISPGVFGTVAAFRPVRFARRILVPLWVGRCHDDVSASGRAIGRLARRAPRAELHDMPGDHFAPFHGDGQQLAIGKQLEFLRGLGLLRPDSAPAGTS
jgi:uncharacterized protein